MLKIAYLPAIIYLVFFVTDGIADESAYKEDHLLVRFAPKDEGEELSTLQKSEMISTLSLGTVKKEYKIVPGLCLVKLSEGKSVQNALETLEGIPGILYAEPDYKIKLYSTFPNDPCFPYLWGLHNTGQWYPLESGGFYYGTPGADINAPEAWDFITDSNVIVAVIDTGVDYNHADLRRLTR